MGERVGNKHDVAVQVDDPHDDGAASSGRSRHGRRAPLCSSCPCTFAAGWLAFTVCATICLVVLKYVVYLNCFPFYSVHLTGYDGIGPGPVVAAVLSPEFNLTLHLRNTCVDRADLTVLYSGVALGWATVEPRDCARNRWNNKALEVVARGDGVGLSDLLRDRLSLEWSNGTVELDVDVKFFRGKRGGGIDSESDMIPTEAIICKVILDGKQDQPMSPCTWTDLRPIVELL